MTEREFLDAISAPMKGIVENLRVLDNLVTERINEVQLAEAPAPRLEPVSPVAETSPPLPPAIPAPLNLAGASERESLFRFGPASERELVGVHPGLVGVTRLALKRSTQDFCVFDGIRTYSEQQGHVRRGTSKTMKSKHLEGLAVDLVPWIDGKPVWDWEGCYKIALAMDEAATALNVANRITWGGAWDRTLTDFGGSAAAMREAVESYKKRHPGPDFIDGPHFEWRK